jgi:hypothetical protein
MYIWCEDWKTLEEMGVDVEVFKMDVRKSEIGSICFTCFRIKTNYWSCVNINIGLIYGIDVFIYNSSIFLK